VPLAHGFLAGDENGDGLGFEGADPEAAVAGFDAGVEEERIYPRFAEEVIERG
jgi:hypothetical protein